MASTMANPYAKVYTNQREQHTSPTSSKKKTYSLVFFRTENKYCVEKTRRLREPDENGVVLVDGTPGTVIREGKCLCQKKASFFFHFI